MANYLRGVTRCTSETRDKPNRENQLETDVGSPTEAGSEKEEEFCLKVASSVSLKGWRGQQQRYQSLFKQTARINCQAAPSLQVRLPAVYHSKHNFTLRRTRHPRSLVRTRNELGKQNRALKRAKREREREWKTPILSDMHIRGGHTYRAIHTHYPPVWPEPPRTSTASACLLLHITYRQTPSGRRPRPKRKRVSIERLPRKRFSTSARVGVHEWTEQRRKAEREREREREWVSEWEEGWLKYRDEEGEG